MAELNADDLELAQSLIARLSAGEYELEEIYGEFWEAIPNPTGFGRAFKKAVQLGHLSGITWARRSVENHQIYLLA